jgi:hypothetical protein
MYLEVQLLRRGQDLPHTSLGLFELADLKKAHTEVPEASQTARRLPMLS